MEELIKSNIVLSVLAILTTGFIAGISAYKGILQITNQTTIIKGTFVLKSDLVGKVLRNEVLGEIRKLIDYGKELDLKNSEDLGESFITRVDIFIQSLDLPLTNQFHGKEMSAPEYTMHLLIMGNDLYGYGNLTLNKKVKRIIGILQGLEASFVSNSGVLKEI